jgi:hypothetical protein
MKLTNSMISLAATLLLAVGASAVQAQTCAPVQECGDVDDSGIVSSSDALRVLKKSVGLPQVLSCGCAETEPPPPTCQTGGLKVTVSAAAPAPDDMAGLYNEAFDCVESEGGYNNGETDFTHCYRKADGSAWRMWNTGCGWQIGRYEAVGCAWQDYARTFSGECPDAPPEQHDERALTTDAFFNNFGEPITGIASGPCTP